MDENAPKILGLILARGGSKSIPKKSIYPCAGKPLLYYTIGAAQNAKRITRLIISTDDEEIAEVARGYGVEVPFMRPKELAEDLTPDLPVFQHALKWLKEKEGYSPDVVVHLRPTTPLKSSADIDKAIQLLMDHSDADSVRSVVQPPQTPFKMYRMQDGEKFLKPLLSAAYPEIFGRYGTEVANMPRHLFPSVWQHAGCIDVIRPAIITEKNSMSGVNILPLCIEEWRGADIETLDELRYVESLIRSREASGKEIWEE